MEDDAVLDRIRTSFADHRIPEAFMAPTRTHRVWLETAGPVPARGAPARARFDQWADERIEDALDAWWPHGRPRIVAFTSDGYLLRRYDEPGCDHLQCVVGLVQRDVADTYAGYLCLDGEEVTASGAMDVRATLTTRGFDRMLYRHPSRRLHPLRRR